MDHLVETEVTHLYLLTQVITKKIKDVLELE